MRGDSLPGCLTLSIAIGIWLALLGVLHGQAPDHDALVLARLCVHEAGLGINGAPPPAADCALIHAVLTGIVERDGVTYQQAARLASPRFARCEVRRRWACGLREDGARPPHWPRRIPWSSREASWLATLEVCRALHRGEAVAPPCAEPPRVWGSRADVRAGRARGSRWVDAECPEARNRGGVWR